MANADTPAKDAVQAGQAAAVGKKPVSPPAAPTNPGAMPCDDGCNLGFPFPIPK